MKITLTQIPSQGVTLKYHKKADEFSVLKELSDNGEVSFVSPFEIEVTAAAREGYYDIGGVIEASVGLTCSRCLIPFTFAMKQRFLLRFSQEIPLDLHPEEPADLELTADQIGLHYFSGDELNLKNAIQEQVILALPFKPLCGKDCKGLCPKCGADLNNSICQCGEKNDGSPFDVLKNLKLT